MEIISHRGLWQTISEKNTPSAFIRSFENGLGTETDLRDMNGEVVISHDCPEGGEIKFEDVLKLMNGRNLTLALNIKADGLITRILELLEKYNHTNYFTFDMSVPDMVFQSKTSAKIFSPLSDIVKEPILLDKADGVWLDAFNSIWYDNKVIENLIEQNKKVCVVSNDLHKRGNKNQWDLLKNNKYITSKNLILCTDESMKAVNFFR